jgi:hypothetical protein
MSVDVLDLPNMAKKLDVRKRAISLTLTAAYLDMLEKMAEAMEYPPSLSQHVDRAVEEYLAARGKIPKRKGSKE